MTDDFINCLLAGLHFRDQALQGADFSGADLRGASFHGATFGVAPRTGAAILGAAMAVTIAAGLVIGWGVDEVREQVYADQWTRLPAVAA